MKNLIRKILREDFDWAIDTPSYDDMHIDWDEHVVPYLTGHKPIWDEDGNLLDFDRWPDISQGERDDLAPLAKHYFVKAMSDVEFKDGKFLLGVKRWEELVPLFKDCNYRGHICKYVAGEVLAEDLDWEPYNDVVYDWKEQVWETINEKTYKRIVEFIREHYIGDDIDMGDDGETIKITNEMVDSWLGDTHILGQIIDDGYSSGGLEDIKNTMRWTYESAYNDAMLDEYETSAHNAITDLLGEGKWERYERKNYNGKTYIGHELEFDISDIFMAVIHTYYEDYCDMEYDHTCELEYSNFLDNLIFIMNEDLFTEQLNPSVSEYPDDDKISEIFNERILFEL
jgi:hypothetical protein